MNTTELIQELSALCVEKDLDFEYKPSWSMMFIDFKEHACYHHEIELDQDDVGEKLKAAIEKVRAL